MPSIRHPQHYPREYYEILRRVVLAGEQVVVPCESPAKARKLRGHFYAFIGALKRHQTEFPDDFAASQRTMVSLENSSLRFQCRDNSWQAQTVAAALAGTASPAPAVPDIPESLRSAVIQEEP